MTIYLVRSLVKLNRLADKILLYFENEYSTSSEVIGAYFVQTVSFKLVL